MTYRPDTKEAQDGATLEADELPAPREPYQAPTCEKKRSIHRVTLLSGMGVTSMGVLSMTN